MHVARNRRTYTAKSGQQRVYESVLVRRSYREGGKVKHQTVANLSGLPEPVVALIEAALKGHRLLAADQTVSISRSLPHGHLAAVHAMAVKPGLLGPPGRHRDLALALIISRVVNPTWKLSTLTWWSATTVGLDLGVAGASTDEIYAARDWPGSRQDAIEAKPARRHPDVEVNPSRMAWFDLSSSWVEGSRCPLAARGHSRDGKRGPAQLEYGLPTDPAGRPVAIRVFPGNTGDPAAFTQIVQVVCDTFALERMVMVGDRGMITSARIEALRELDEPLGWITALRRSPSSPLTTAHCSCHWTPRTWPRSPTRTTPVNAWSPAATRTWRSSAPAHAPSCSRPPKRCSPRCWPGCAQAGSRQPTRSGSRSAK
jgi:hypothetical protein